MYIEDPTFILPPEIYTPCNAPDYKPAYAGHEALDLNLTVEGGALRAIFGAGVLDFLMDMGVWAKNLIGVSAGALSGFNYVAGSRGRTIYINGRFCPDWRYLSLRSFLVTGNVYGVQFAFHDIPRLYCPQDNEGFMGSPCKLHTVQTNLHTGKAEYHVMGDPATDWVYLRASSAMPFVSKASLIDGELYLDGGLADSIPIEYSLELGAAKQIVILTQARDFVKGENRKMGLGRMLYRAYPRFCETMENRHNVYNRTRADIARMHEAGEVFAIYPREEPQVTHLESDRNKLFGLYMDGYLEAQRVWPELKAYLGL